MTIKIHPLLALPVSHPVLVRLRPSPSPVDSLAIRRNRLRPHFIGCPDPSWSTGAPRLPVFATAFPRVKKLVTTRTTFNRPHTSSRIFNTISCFTRTSSIMTPSAGSTPSLPPPPSTPPVRHRNILESQKSCNPTPRLPPSRRRNRRMPPRRPSPAWTPLALVAPCRVYQALSTSQAPLPNALLKRCQQGKVQLCDDN